LVNLKEMPAKPDHVIPAIERGLQVPKVHVSQLRALTLAEIAQHTAHTANAHCRITEFLTKSG
jgi:hypothetical protein